MYIVAVQPKKYLITYIISDYGCQSAWVDMFKPKKLVKSKS